VLAWAQEKLTMRGLTATQVASPGDEELEGLIDSLHTELVPLGLIDTLAAERLGSMLRAAIQSEPGLAKLMDDPLFLVVMAVIHAKGELFEGRAALCCEAIGVLLTRWDDARSGTNLEEILREVDATREHLLSMLRGMAFTAHGSTPARDSDGNNGVADIAESVLAANSAELQLRDVSPVGCFPSGATPEGLQDMAGNVMEWVRRAGVNVFDSRDDTHPYAIMSAVFDAPPQDLRCGRRFYFKNGGPQTQWRFSGVALAHTIIDNAEPRSTQEPRAIDCMAQPTCRARSGRGPRRRGTHRAPYNHRGRRRRPAMALRRAHASCAGSGME
jgi:hypothetical protein